MAWFRAWYRLPVSVGHPWADLFEGWRDVTGRDAWRVVLGADDRWRQDVRVIEHLDFGAGTGSGRAERKAVRALARSASTDARKGRWLMAAVAGVASGNVPVRILELGTCLGSGGDFMLSAAPPGSHYTGLEGSPDLLRLTEERLQHHRDDGHTVELREGPFHLTLPAVLDDGEGWDVVFLDGCHEGKVVLEQWRLLEPHLRPGALVVVDDIRWSRDMHEAWLQLARNPGVDALDLFRMGLLHCPRSGQSVRRRPVQHGTARAGFRSRA